MTYMGPQSSWFSSDCHVASHADSPWTAVRSAAKAAVAASLAAFLLVACSDTQPAGTAPAGTAASSPAPAAEDTGPQHLRVEVLERTSFNPRYFTQGLEVAPDGSLLVGTGKYGESGVYRVDPRAADQAPAQQVELGAEYFGEGITRSGTTLWQLTWKNGTARSYDADSLRPTGQAALAGEGWGLCSLGGGTDDPLVLSDGTNQLRIIDPHTFAEQRRVNVTRNSQPVAELNELECVDGVVYANVWMSTDILRIDPASGQVTGVIDAAPATNNAANDVDNVLNGIAHIPGTDEFYLTGKHWPDLYRVRFVN